MWQSRRSIYVFINQYQLMISWLAQELLAPEASCSMGGLLKCLCDINVSRWSLASMALLPYSSVSSPQNFLNPFPNFTSYGKGCCSTPVSSYSAHRFCEVHVQLWGRCTVELQVAVRGLVEAQCVGDAHTLSDLKFEQLLWSTSYM